MAKISPKSSTNEAMADLTAFGKAFRVYVFNDEHLN
jgi:hypothetical protein